MKLLPALIAAPPFALGATALQAQTVTLKVSHYLGSNHNFHSQVLEPWCAELDKGFGRQAQVPDLPGAAARRYRRPAARSGQERRGRHRLGLAELLDRRFPRSEALELPFTLPRSSLGGSLAMWDYTQKYAMDDFKDFKVLSIWSGSGIVISTASKPVIVPEDIKGLEAAQPRAIRRCSCRALGGVPVNMPPAQITEGISKGIIDGAMAPWEVLPAVKVDEVTRYHIEGPARQPASRRRRSRC